MIFKLTFDDGRIDWCTANSFLHLIKSYDALFDLVIQEIESIEEVPDDEAKKIMVLNTEFSNQSINETPEISLYDLAVGSDFAMIASTEFD